MVTEGDDDDGFLGEKPSAIFNQNFRWRIVVHDAI